MVFRTLPWGRPEGEGVTPRQSRGKDSEQKGGMLMEATARSISLAPNARAAVGREGSRVEGRS